jgi:hypothetical protein
MEKSEQRNASYSILFTKINRVIKSRRMKWGGQLARTGEMINSYKILVGKHTGNRQLGRPRRRWENNKTIKMGLGEIGCKDVDWIQMAQDRVKW